MTRFLIGFAAANKISTACVLSAAVVCVTCNAMILADFAERDAALRDGAESQRKIILRTVDTDGPRMTLDVMPVTN